METILTVVFWSFLALFIVGIVWAIGVASDIQSRPTHHDSRPGSHYFESNKKK